MAAVKQKMTAQTNVNFRLSPSNSHQTHIVLIEDAYTVLGGSDVATL